MGSCKASTVGEREGPTARIRSQRGVETRTTDGQAHGPVKMKVLTIFRETVG